jgi:hypothetical protein
MLLSFLAVMPLPLLSVDFIAYLIPLLSFSIDVYISAPFIKSSNLTKSVCNSRASSINPDSKHSLILSFMLEASFLAWFKFISTWLNIIVIITVISLY